MKKKVLLAVLTVAFIITAVAIGVHLLHKDALAENYSEQLTLDWNGVTPSDVEATAELLDENGEPLLETVGIELTPNSSATVWTCTIISDAAEAAMIRFNWIEGTDDEDWGEGENGDPDVPPAVVDITLPITFYLSTIH